jgi:hypothetical protein
MGLEALDQVVHRKIIGKQVFDAGEAGLGCRLEAVEKWPFGEQHGQVGIEAGHDGS